MLAVTKISFIKRLSRKRIETFLGKCLWCSPVLIKSQVNVTKPALQHFPRIFWTFYLHDPFCRTYSCFFFWFFDVFLVFNGKVLLCSLSKPFIHWTSEEQLLWKFQEKELFSEKVILIDLWNQGLMINWSSAYSDT